MEPEGLDQHLSRITTLWTLVRRANQGPGDEARAAQRPVVHSRSLLLTWVDG